jgi:cell division protein FtsQ
MRKRLVIALTLLFLFTSYKPQKLSLSPQFHVKKIIIENNFILQDEEIKKDLTYLFNESLFFLDTSIIKKILVEKSFIESFEIKKIYPNKLNIKIFEKQPIAILHYKKEKFYISKNGELINYLYLENYNNLPTVFGNKENFNRFYNELKLIKFPIEQIKKFYSFESKRWDLLTNKDQTIKLPTKNYIKSLENFMNLKKKNNFDKYKVFDYRINNQLILK